MLMYIFFLADDDPSNILDDNLKYIETIKFKIILTVNAYFVLIKHINISN